MATPSVSSLVASNTGFGRKYANHSEACNKLCANML